MITEYGAKTKQDGTIVVGDEDEERRTVQRRNRTELVNNDNGGTGTKDETRCKGEIGRNL
jgi:hypothetical protein